MLGQRTYILNMKRLIIEEHTASFIADSMKKNRGTRIVVDNNDLHFLRANVYSYGFAGTYMQVVCRLRSTGKRAYLSRVLMNVTDPRIVVDHINRDPLDNRRCNLRLCSHTESVGNIGMNHTNKSGYKGVSFHKRCNKWRAVISKGNTHYHIGYAMTARDAALMYDKEARKHFGENFAATNEKLGLL